MITLQKTALALVVVGLAASLSAVRAASVIHWINNSNQNGSTVLNGGNAFTTTFRTAGDVNATKLGGTFGGLFTDNFGAPTPGNNPAYLTSFVGASASGTGDGAAGHMGFFDLGGGATSSLQLDFAAPLTSADRLLLVDADSNEQYHIEAFALVSASYVPLSLTGWTYETFSGQTGVIPDSRWPTWNAASGILTAGSSGLNEELSVLTPDQQVSRLVISKLTGGGFSTGIQVIELTGTAGDYNQNGIVDAADYVVWRENKNTTNVLANDPIGGTIGAPQYDQWRAHFGQGTGSGANTIPAVPEPASMLELLLMTAIGLKIRFPNQRFGRRSAATKQTKG